MEVYYYTKTVNYILEINLYKSYNYLYRSN